MDIRYVFNTSGEYVAFIAAGDLFTPVCDWLGPLRQDEVYNTQGQFVGNLRPDGRIARDRSDKLPRQILYPRVPMRPVRPLPPKRGLILPTLYDPLEDVFDGLPRPLKALVSVNRLEELNQFHGCILIAQDGTFLGSISKDRNNSDSLADRHGPFGSPAKAGSILNETGLYGSPDSPLSPFHTTTTTPPQIQRDGEFVAYLSANAELPNRVDPNELLAWLAMR